MGLLFKGNQDYSVNGDSRVVAFHVSNGNSYEKCLRMSTITVDIASKRAWDGKKSKKTLSNQHNSRFKHELKAEARGHKDSQKIGKILMFTGLGFLGGAIIWKTNEEELTELRNRVKRYEQWRTDSNKKLNLLEGRIEKHITIGQLSQKERYKVARNMCAYRISEDTANSLRLLETELQHRFSSETILDLLIYEKRSGVITEKKRILKQLKKVDYQSTPLSTKKRMAAVKDATLEARLKQININRKLRSQYS